jgi:imidazolonepropionase-like amidohydrolase
MTRTGMKALGRWNALRTRIATRALTRTGTGTLAVLAALSAVPGFLMAPVGAEAQVPAPQQRGPIAVVGGTIHPISGPAIPNGTLVFEGGVITAIGSTAGVQIPAGAQRIDATGHHVYPGLIDGWSAMGLTEIGGIDVATDLNELGDINPNVRAAVAFHAESRHIGTTRSNGILTTLSTPSGGLMPGKSSAMMMDGWTWDAMTLKAEAALVVSWPGTQNRQNYTAALRTLREVFADARAYLAARNAAHAAGQGATFATDSRMEAMESVLAGAIPVAVQANTIEQMTDAIAWAEDEGVRLLLVGARDAGYMLDRLAEAQVPVLLSTVMDRPGRDHEPVDHHRTLPGRLHAAGIPFAIVGGSSAPYANRLPYEAGSAITAGLPEMEAIRALTLYPAQFFGIDDRVGSLEVGKDATFLVTTGNPLDYIHSIERAFVQGRDIDLSDAHRQFYERYAEKLRQVREAEAASGGEDR